MSGLRPSRPGAAGSMASEATEVVTSYFKTLIYKIVILSEAKNLVFFKYLRPCASLRVTEKKVLK